LVQQLLSFPFHRAVLLHHWVRLHPLLLLSHLHLLVQLRQPNPLNLLRL
jgi:hypothetical protein